MKRFLKGAATGLAFAGIASFIARIQGFNSGTLMIFLYLYVVLGVAGSIKSALTRHGGLGDFLHNLVIVVEGEEMKMKKLLTGEKYRIDGDVEKL